MQRWNLLCNVQSTSHCYLTRWQEETLRNLVAFIGKQFMILAVYLTTCFAQAEQRDVNSVTENILHHDVGLACGSGSEKFFKAIFLQCEIFINQSYLSLKCRTLSLRCKYWKWLFSSLLLPLCRSQVQRLHLRPDTSPSPTPKLRRLPIECNQRDPKMQFLNPFDCMLSRELTSKKRRVDALS